MLPALGIVIIIEEVNGKLWRILIHLFRQGANIPARSSTIFRRALTTDLIENRHTLLVGLRVAHALTAGTPHIVHTDGGKSLDTMVYLRSTDRITSSATDTDYTYLICIYSRMIREEIDCRAEIFHPYFR